MPLDNNDYQRNANICLIAKTVWLEKTISRAEIARKLSLYRSTVTNLTSYLLETGVLKEGNLLGSTRQGGRPAVELSINPKFGCVAGFDIQPSHYRFVLTALDGSEIYSERGSVGYCPFEEMTIKILNKSFETVRKIDIPVLALAFAVPGVVDTTTGTILYSNPFNVENVKISDIVEKVGCHLPVYVENDANAAAWLDTMKTGFKGNLLCVVSDFHEESKIVEEVVGIGTGLGIVVDGKVYHGSNYAAGEFKSVTWNCEKNRQSGIPAELLKLTADDKENLQIWFEDLISSFIPLVSAMDFDTIVFHGEPYSDHEWTTKIVKERIPAMATLLKTSDCKIVFDTEDECISATGATMMCLFKFFSVPELGSEDSGRLSWKELVAYSQKHTKNK